MSEITDVYFQFKSMIINYLADRGGDWVSVEDLVDHFGVPYPILNKPLYEERMSKAALIELGSDNGAPSYRFTGVEGAVPDMPKDPKGVLNAILNGENKAQQPERKSPAGRKKKSDAQKALEGKSGKDKATEVIARVAKKIATKNYSSQSSQPSSQKDTEEMKADVYSVAKEKPSTTASIADYLGADEGEVLFAANALEETGLVHLVVLEIDDKKMVIANDGVEPPFVVPDTKSLSGKYRPLATINKPSDDGIKNDVRAGAANDAESIIIEVARLHPMSSRGDLLIDAGIIAKERGVSRSSLAEAMLDMLSDGKLISEQDKERGALYRLPDWLQEKESANNDFVDIMLRVLDLDSSGDEEEDKNSIISLVTEMVESKKAIAKMAREILLKSE